MFQDAYGKEVKVGDHILYATSAGAGSGIVREYVVDTLETRRATSWSSRFNEEKADFEWGHFEHETAYLLARPIVNKRIDAWPRSTMRPVRLTYPGRIVVITGVDLTKRYGEPEVADGN
jgi:hypothetical protein